MHLTAGWKKAYITFPAEFWTENYAREIKRSCVSCPLTTPTPPNTDMPSFRHFLQPQYIPDIQKSWTIELVPLGPYRQASSKGGGTLLFSLYGPDAIFVASSISEHSSKSSEYLESLVDFFSPYYRLLPNYAADDLKCVLVGALATNWQNDKLAGYSSYTNFQTTPSLPEGGCETQLDDDIRAMRHGMPERGIWLAGEHTAPFVAVGTSTGAYWSGESVAMRILATNGLI